MENNQQMTLQQKSQQSITSANNKIDHIRMLVSQSYNIFNRYGKDGDALRDITRAFIEDLGEYTAEQITQAFKAWRRTSSGMPTPANIIDEIKGQKQTTYTGKASWSEFSGKGGSWCNYKKYLHEIGLLSENFQVTGGRIYLKNH